MWRIKSIGILLFVSLLVISTGADAVEFVVFVSSEAVGAQTVVDKNTLVKIVLPGNAATGHRWDIVSSGAPFLQQEGEVHYTPEGAHPDAGGRFTAAFRAVQNGEARIRLIYRNYLKQDAVIGRTYELPVIVSRQYRTGEVFKMLDCNRDGRATLDEFRSAKAFPVEVNANGHPILPNGRVDSNGDGIMSAEEVRTGQFENFDLNHDGVIEPQELEQSVGNGFVLFSF